MTAPPDVLLLADPPVARDLAQYVGEQRLTTCADPYEALERMRDRDWTAVVVSAPREDLDGFLRASRRLQRTARLLALCPPTAEPHIRALAPAALDDYLLYPAAREDVRRLLNAPTDSPAPPPRSAAAEPAQTNALLPDDLAALLDATASTAALESAIAALLARRLGTAFLWKDAAALTPDEEVLLLADTNPPRAVVTKDPPADGAAARAGGCGGAGFLGQLQRVLPSLLAAAERTEGLFRLATTDHLTGAVNRRHFYQRTDEVLARARAANLRVTMLLYDIDNFKRYNDTYGHAAGDEILRETAELMRRTTRRHDIVARIGGDEFAVLFWDPDPPRSPGSRPPETPQILADRFRRTVNCHAFPSLGPEATGVLTISGGLAVFPRDGATCRDLLRTCDRGLKSAKENGKNTIRLVGGA